MTLEPPPHCVRIGFIAALCLAMAAGVFTQFAVGALAPYITADLSLSRTAFGALNTALYLVGALSSRVLGRFVDAVGGRRSLVALFACAGLAWIWMAVAPSYWWLLLGVGLSGIPLAISNPATNLLISVHVTPLRQGVVVGTKQAGALASAVVAGFALPLGAAYIGWRGALAVSAALALAAIGIVASSVPRRGARPQASEPRRGTLRLVRWLSAYAFFMGVGLAAVFAYLPLYAFERLDLAPATAGLTVSLMGAVGTGAVIVWTWGAGRIGRTSGPLIALGMLSSVATLAVWMAPVANWLLWFGTVLLGATGLSWFAVAFLAIVRGVGTGVTGRASAAVGLAIFVGFVASPIAFGWLVDVTGSYGPAWGAVSTAFLIAGAVAVGWHHRDPRVEDAGP
jgi:predicted MFS family arabinose efflux permease